MRKQNIEERVESRVYEQLEDWVRERIQGWVQELLEEEVTELLGRRKSERRRAVDAVSGYRNGYGKPRHLTMSSGTIQVRRPRVRDLEERFESRVLPLFAKRTRQVRELIPELYLHGLALGDFDPLRGLLGDKAPLSASTVARLKEKWQAEWEVWQSRPLDDPVKAGLEKEKAVLLVVLAALSDEQSRGVGHEWLSGIDPELVGSTARLEAAGDGLSTPGDRRRPPDLGSFAQCLSPGRGAALPGSSTCWPSSPRECTSRPC